MVYFNFELISAALLFFIYLTEAFSLDSIVVRRRGMPRRPALKNIHAVDWTNFMSDKENEYLLHRKRQLVLNQKSCRPVLTVLSTYTHERGIQSPNTIETMRCQGGSKNPENYQCQPSKVVIECFHLKNEQGLDDFLGVYSHQSCEERCVCGRKDCKNKQLYNLVCPRGFQEDKTTCQCTSKLGESIFYRSMGVIADWDMNLHTLCRSKSNQYSTQAGESFMLRVV